MPNLRLISTDYDGTCVPAWGGPQEMPCELVEAIGKWRARGAVWAVNTGRSPALLNQAWGECGAGIRPDYALTSERDVWRPCDERAGEWAAFGDWNRRAAAEHRALLTETLPVLHEAIGVIRRRHAGVRVLYGFDHVNGKDEPAGLVAENEEHMDWIVGHLEGLGPRAGKLSYQRNSIYLRFSHADHHKGAALAELGRLLGIPPEEIFAAGDHYNDLSMLDGAVAGHVACPSNAIAPVKEAVRRAGGHVSGLPDGRGVAEALRRLAA